MFYRADSRGQLECERREGCKLLSLTFSDSVGGILHLSDARKTRVTENQSYRTRQGRSPQNPQELVSFILRLLH